MWPCRPRQLQSGCRQNSNTCCRLTASRLTPPLSAVLQAPPPAPSPVLADDVTDSQPATVATATAATTVEASATTGAAAMTGARSSPSLGAGAAGTATEQRRPQSALHMQLASAATPPLDPLTQPAAAAAGAVQQQPVGVSRPLSLSGSVPINVNAITDIAATAAQLSGSVGSDGVLSTSGGGSGAVLVSQTTPARQPRPKRYSLFVWLVSSSAALSLLLSSCFLCMGVCHIAEWRCCGLCVL